MIAAEWLQNHLAVAHRTSQKLSRFRLVCLLEAILKPFLKIYGIQPFIYLAAEGKASGLWAIAATSTVAS